MSKTVIFSPYNPLWPLWFEEEKKKLHLILGENAVAIHHVGSTAVPYLAAKPIIDIVIVTENISAFEECNPQLKEQGYLAKGEMGMCFRRFYSRGENPRTHHLHVYSKENDEITQYLTFRDHMRTHPDDLKAYGVLKHTLSILYKEDRDSYTLGKDSFIKAIIEKTGFQGYRLVQVLTSSEWKEYHRIRKPIFEELAIKYDEHHPSMTQKNCFHFVFSKGVKILGASCIEFIAEPQNAAILRILAIDEPYRNKGYGAMLLNLMEKWVQQWSKEILYLHARPKAFTFYTRNHYSKMEFFDNEGFHVETIDMGKYLPIG